MSIPTPPEGYPIYLVVLLVAVGLIAFGLILWVCKLSFAKENTFGPIGPDTISGGGGNDTITGGSGPDILAPEPWKK